MGKPVAGEVVVLPFPQTNLQTGKRALVWPALILTFSPRRRNCPGASLVLRMTVRPIPSLGSSMRRRALLRSKRKLREEL